MSACPRNRVLGDWLAWLETLSPHEVELGLERVTAVLERLALARPRRVVHVAGTNGKGSTVAMVEALYRGDASRKVACYTSPHVERYNERMRVAGRDLDDDAILDAFEAVEAVRHDIPLTYFEFGTLAAFVAFSGAGADTWILEIGLGGRLDAVNALDPDGAIITNISLDHCEWLGNDVESIAREKAGVMRPGMPVVFAGDRAPRAIRETAEVTGATLLLRGRDFRITANAEGTWNFSGSHGILQNLARPALAGDIQVVNAAGALALYLALEPEADAGPAAIDAAFASLHLPGRLQRIVNARNWLLDVAHNPGAAAVLAQAIGEEPVGGKVVAILGVLADKDVEGILEPLRPHVDRWIAVTPAAARALPARRLAQTIAARSGQPCRIVPDIGEAIPVAARLSDPGDLLVVSGSFYTVGPALTCLSHCDILASR